MERVTAKSTEKVQLPKSFVLHFHLVLETRNSNRQLIWTKFKRIVIHGLTLQILNDAENPHRP